MGVPRSNRKIDQKNIHEMYERARVQFVSRLMTPRRHRLGSDRVARIALDAFRAAGNLAAEHVEKKYQADVRNAFGYYGVIRGIETLLAFQPGDQIRDLELVRGLNTARVNLAVHMYPYNRKLQQKINLWERTVKSPGPESINRDELKRLKKAIIEEELNPVLGGRGGDILSYINERFTADASMIDMGIRLIHKNPLFSLERGPITIKPELK